MIKIYTDEERRKLEAEQAPAANWNNHALLRAARGHANTPDDVALAKELCVDRLELYVKDREEPTHGYVVMSADGHWGAGPSLHAAALRCRESGAARKSMITGTLVLGDVKPEVNSAGYIIADSHGHIIQLGRLGQLGSILNVNAA